MIASPTPIAWLLPGQGVDLTGLGTWVRFSDVVRARVEQAGRLSNCDAVRLLTTGGPRLSESAVTQPILVAAVLGIAEVLTKSGLTADLCAGHSLGQLPALAIAGALDVDVAIELAAVRGRVMSAAARLGTTGMIAITADEDTLERALEAGRSRGPLCVGGRNAPGRFVLSGDEAALRMVLARFSATRLRVEGAWHSPAMAPAVLPWQSALEQAPLRPPKIPVLDGESGLRLHEPGEIRRALVRQLTQPFDWTRVSAELRRAGVRRLVALGPSKVLRDLAHENLGRDVAVVGTDTFDLTTTTLEARPC